jgi:hypothetical protein
MIDTIAGRYWTRCSIAGHIGPQAVEVKRKSPASRPGFSYAIQELPNRRGDFGDLDAALMQWAWGAWDRPSPWPVRYAYLMGVDIGSGGNSAV